MSFKKQTALKMLNWTPSKLDMYEQCPAKLKYKYLDKLPEPVDPDGPLAYGTAVHAAAEQFITSRTKALHAGLKHKSTKKIVETLRADYKKKKVRVELELAFNRSWRPVAWLAKDVYCRFKVDVLHLRGGGAAVAIDWKTGKLKDDPRYDDQLNAYSTAILSAGLAQSVTAQLVFTEHGATVERPAGTLTVKQLPAAQKEWDRKVKAMLGDTRFAPRPGDGCRWCPYSTNRGGPCEF